MQNVDPTCVGNPWVRKQILYAKKNINMPGITGTIDASQAGGTSLFEEV